MAIKFEDLPPQVQNQLKQLQQFQQQLEMVMQQRLQVDIRLRDTENALEELNKIDEGTPVYKGVGNLIIRADKEKLIKELSEEKESLEIRRKSLEGQENRIKEKIEKDEIVAIKIHFGEMGNIRYIRPTLTRQVVDMVKNPSYYITLMKHTRLKYGG